MNDSNKAITTVVEKAKPEIITIGNRQIISTGNWNKELVSQRVIANGLVKWFSIGDLAKFAFGSSTKANQARARKCVSALWQYMLVEKGCLMVVQYSSRNGPAQAVKVYNPQSEEDRQALKAKLEKLKKSGDFSSQRYEFAVSLLEPRGGSTP